MNLFGDGDEDKCKGDQYVKPGATDTTLQLAISLTLGLSAFLTFCIIRPRWKSLYAARKRRLDPSIGLPALPDTFFGWIPALYKVTEQQILASAGLDAFVFLNFFKMAMKLFTIMFVFAAVVLWPINRRYVTDPPPDHSDDEDPDKSYDPNLGYLWSYMIFTYFFTGLTIYIMNKETFRVIRVRQDYLGTQSTLTDRTFRMTGIPKELRNEDAIKDLVERLEIGRVESVSVCRVWKELDDLIEERQKVLAKLEESWSVYLNQKPMHPAGGPQNPTGSNGGGPSEANSGVREPTDEEAGESDQLLRNPSHNPWIDRPRPQTRFWYGFLRLQSRKTDAIDYYTEKLRQLDDKILAARKKKYKAADNAFVTMDSIAACQMAIQAVIGPRPGQLLTKPAPSPSDIVWRNTYAPRLGRRVRSWSVTAFVCLLTVLWTIPVAFLASVMSICTIEAVFPTFAQSLREHELLRSLVQTGLPTAVVSLLNIAVPYLYDYLSYHQGMLSQGDIALSVISKNFFFTFFNIFLIFTIFGAVAPTWEVLRHSLKDTTYLAYTLAGKIENLIVFYINFIMLQGLGLFPFRLLEFGSITLYPIYRLGAKTPRDFAEMIQPPMFYYGFYLPTALMIFILCLIYSALPNGFLILGLGVVYFTLGYYTHKYQLLYAMDQPQHATGGAWRMICYRIMLGLVVFQLTMSGYLALRSVYTVALLVTPLPIATLWYSYYFKRRFEPLTRFISLQSIKRGEDPGADAVLDDDEPPLEGGEGQRELFRRGSTVDEDRERGLRFVNPSLVVPLVQPWIYKEPPPPLPSSLETGDGLEYDGRGNNRGAEYEVQQPDVSAPEAPGNNRPARGASASSNSSSSVSLGDTHIWREG
ncbi:calcium permeable stress-gated cation channel 1 [Echria macrotheca]|uniref:Calcium permeable stress-gated cation channel 1 n=1 Tax=Echria macrotheca TaxID=438768 RepID=A0AAJ0F7E6_9PEZI|nr:calcium permeable stress-gated cation channel 1 [Echria macrotheca]